MRFAFSRSLAQQATSSTPGISRAARACVSLILPAPRMPMRMVCIARDLSADVVRPQAALRVSASSDFAFTEHAAASVSRLEAVDERCLTLRQTMICAGCGLMITRNDKRRHRPPYGKLANDLAPRATRSSHTTCREAGRHRFLTGTNQFGTLEVAGAGAARDVHFNFSNSAGRALLTITRYVMFLRCWTQKGSLHHGFTGAF